MFVKLIQENSFYEAAVAASVPLSQNDIPTPRLLDHGTLADGRTWLAYAWHDLTDFEPTPSLVEHAVRSSVSCTPERPQPHQKESPPTVRP